MTLPFNRRSFIQAGSAALAGSATLTTIPFAMSETRKMTMDLVCGAIGVQADQKKAIALASKFGFESVQPNVDQLAVMSDGQISEVLDLLQQSGLKWGAAGLPLEFRRDEAKFKEDLSRLKTTAPALVKAKVSRMGTWIMPAHDSLTYLQNFRQHAERLRETGYVLADSGIRLGLEYVGPKTSWTSKKYPFLHTMAETKDLLSEIGLENVGFVLDSWHWYTAGDTEEDLLELKNEEIVAVDLNDAPEGIPVDQQMDLKRRLPMETGVIDLKTFLSALVQIGYDGPVRAEPFDSSLREMEPEKAVKKTADAMKKAFSLID
jgi:sugar phosphate isomerase/epimerase